MLKQQRILHSVCVAPYSVFDFQVVCASTILIGLSKLNQRTWSPLSATWYDRLNYKTN